MGLQALHHLHLQAMYWSIFADIAAKRSTTRTGPVSITSPTSPRLHCSWSQRTIPSWAGCLSRNAAPTPTQFWLSQPGDLLLVQFGPTVTCFDQASSASCFSFSSLFEGIYVYTAGEKHCIRDIPSVADGLQRQPHFVW